MTVSEIAGRLGLEIICAPAPDRPVQGVYIGDLLSWVMGRARAGEAWITIMSNQNVAAVAVLAELGCVILAENVRPSEELLEAAQQRGVNLLRADRSVYDLAWRLHRLLAEAERPTAEERP